MHWIIFTGIAVALLPQAYLWILMRALRRVGRPDPAGERILLAWTATTLTGAVVIAVLDNPPRFLIPVIIGPMVLTSTWLVAHRIRKHAEAVFSPQTLRRFRALRGRGHR